MSDVCNTKIELINLLIDDKLNQHEKTDLENHISSCSKCQRYYNDISTIKNETSKISLVLPKDFSKSVLSEIKNRNNSNKRIIKFVKYSTSAIAACLVIVVSILLLNNGFMGNDKTSEQLAVSSLDQAILYGESEKVVTENVAPTTFMTTDDNRGLIEYDYLVKINNMKIDEVISNLNDKFSIHDYSVYDEYIVFTTNEDLYRKIIEVLKLEIVEEKATNDKDIIVKILVYNGE